ncbi:hypothetical protein RND81_05G067000 [Saponaria officinalis]|uniref:BHLH domain-containing protein n=1 Tax=Saponaria officinalis TaxID=3572 RepID=A0AAW1KTY1_SAPOF
MEFFEEDNKMGSFDDNFIDGFFDGSFIYDDTSLDFSLVNSSSFNIDFSQKSGAPQEHESLKPCPKQSYSIDIDFSHSGSAGDENESEMEYPKKRARTDKPKTKACRERERREKFNISFLGLSSVLEPGRIAKTDKLAILNDAIQVVKQLRTEAKNYKEENKKLQEEIQCLKAEKNELREEKLTLKAEKQKMEQQLKTMNAPSFPAAAFHGGVNKMDVYPSYGMYPMWHYLPPSTRDISHDHELRPPAA